MTEEIQTEVPTPILDSGVLPPLDRKKAPSRIRSLLTLFAGIVALLPVIAWTDKTKNPKSGFVLFIFALVLTITVHELGHLLAGWAVGFRFADIRVGPFSLRLEHGRPRIAFYRETFGSGSAGMYVGSVRRLRRRLMIFLAGGPLANVVSVPTTVLLFNYAFAGLAETWVGTLGAQFTVFSLIAGMVNLMPIKVAGLLSDGARLQMFFRSRDRSRRWLSIAALASLHGSGIRARNWKRTWANAAASLHDNSLDSFAGEWLAYASSSDRDEASAAGIHLERCLELTCKLPRSARDVVAQEAAFFAAWFRSDVALAEQWVTQIKKPRKLSALVQLRLNVALQCAYRDYERAERSWQEGLELIEKTAVRPIRDGLRESWLEWQIEVENRKAKSRSTWSH